MNSDNRETISVAKLLELHPEVKKIFDGSVGEPSPCVILAFDGCMDHCGWELGAEDKETQNQVLLACLDEIPNGEEAAKLAAANKLREIHRSRGWWEDSDGWLTGGNGTCEH